MTDGWGMMQVITGESWEPSVERHGFRMMVLWGGRSERLPTQALRQLPTCIEGVSTVALANLFVRHHLKLVKKRIRSRLQWSLIFSTSMERQS